MHNDLCTDVNYCSSSKCAHRQFAGREPWHTQYVEGIGSAHALLQNWVPAAAAACLRHLPVQHSHSSAVWVTVQHTAPRLLLHALDRHAMDAACCCDQTAASTSVSSPWPRPSQHGNLSVVMACIALLWDCQLSMHSAPYACAGHAVLPFAKAGLAAVLLEQQWLGQLGGQHSALNQTRLVNTLSPACSMHLHFKLPPDVSLWCEPAIAKCSSSACRATMSAITQFRA